MGGIHPQRILAIDPGTRYVGIAVLEDGELLYHGVTNLRRRRRTSEFLADGRRLIQTLLQDFRPSLVAIEQSFFVRHRRALLLNLLVREIKVTAKREGVPLIALAPSHIKKRITGQGHASKNEVARAVISIFPHLRVFSTQDRKWKERYHSNMFDAVATGLAVRSHIDKPVAA